MFSTLTPPTYFLVALASFNIIFVALNIHWHPMLPKKLKLVQLGALGVSNVPFQCPHNPVTIWLFLEGIPIAL
jgi:hypothetical protein